MTSLTTPPNTTHFRRHSDPPKLWLRVLAGSLVIHLIAWVVIQNFLAIAVIQADSTPIAVEFLEPIEESVPPQQKAKRNETAEVSTQVTSPPAIAPTRSVTEPSATMPARKAPIQTISPKKTVIKEPVPTKATSNARLPNVPTVPNPTDIKQDSSGAIASIAISSTPVPAKFVAQFRAIAAPSKPSDSFIKSTSAQLLGESTQSFSSDPDVCSLTPEALRSFGQPVTLKLPLDETGAFKSQQPVMVEQSSGNTRYDELAICVAKNSRFAPAYTLEGNTKRAVSSDLEIQVTLIQ